MEGKGTSDSFLSINLDQTACSIFPEAGEFDAIEISRMKIRLLPPKLTETLITETSWTIAGYDVAGWRFFGGGLGLLSSKAMK
jgi:hypothetical protein